MAYIRKVMPVVEVIELYTSRSKILNAACEKHPHIAECDSDTDGYWVYMEPGYICVDTGNGTIHNYTVADCLDEMQNIVEGVYVDGHTIPFNQATPEQIEAHKVWVESQNEPNE